MLRAYSPYICAVPRRLFSAFSDYYFTEIRFIGEVMCGASAVAVLKFKRFWSFVLNSLLYDKVKIFAFLSLCSVTMSLEFSQMVL